MKNPDFTEIKKTTDIVRVVESYGIKLKKGSKEFVGLCPFHKDGKDPNLYVNREKGVFFCQACGATGSVIDFVMRKDGLDKKEAGLKLCTQIPGIRRLDEGMKTSSSQPYVSEADPSAVVPITQRIGTETERVKLLQRVIGFYMKTLHQDRAGLEYLKERNLSEPTMLEVFQVGYCNGTLHKALPEKGEIVDQLKAIGILDGKGKEVFAGRVTVPIFDTAGNVVGIYARNIHPCEPKDRHRYLAGPHRGVFNSACLKTFQTAFITEAIFDAMAFWQAGFRDVISLYGNQGWTADHEKLFQDNPIMEVVLALDNDERSREQMQKLREKLSGMVKAVHVIEWPDGVKDACDFFLSHSAADFETLLKAASPQTEQKSEVTARLGDEEITMTPDGFAASYGSRRYELFAVEKPSPAKLKATIKAVSSNTSGVRFHFDTVDFFLSRSRRNFILEAARLFQETAETIEADLNRLTLQVESYAAKRLEEKMPRVTLISESDKAEGLKLGRAEDLVSEILGDAKKLGVVGESVPVLLDYLGVTSRKLDDPLAIHILSSSGAGKSFLLDAILSFCPPEDLIKVTSLSDKALFYKGENSLVHKVLAIEEVAGALGARYAIRSLISEKILKSETTIKNPLTGRMETQVSVVYGAPSVFETTTDPDTDEETRSRFMIQTVDESTEQTRAILEAQRNSHTAEGWERKLARGMILARHHAFQRLLKPLRVINPFEPLLGYGDDRLLFRRDHPKYLNLILVITFLFQMQRPIKQSATIGEHIEVALDDIALANELALELFGHSLDDLPPPSRELLRLIRVHVRRRATELGVEPSRVEFHRRELREALKLSEFQLRKYLRPLVELEYIQPVGGRFGQLYSYRLLYDVEGETSGKFVPGLKDVEQILRETIAIGLLPTNTRPTPKVFASQTSCAKIEPRAEKRDLVHTSCDGLHEVSESDFERRNGNGKANLVQFSGEHIEEFAHHGNGVIRAV